MPASVYDNPGEIMFEQEKGVYDNFAHCKWSKTAGGEGQWMRLSWWVLVRCKVRHAMLPFRDRNMRTFSHVTWGSCFIGGYNSRTTRWRMNGLLPPPFDDERSLAKMNLMLDGWGELACHQRSFILPFLML